MVTSVRWFCWSLNPIVQWLRCLKLRLLVWGNGNYLGRILIVLLVLVVVGRVVVGRVIHRLLNRMVCLGFVRRIMVVILSVILILLIVLLLILNLLSILSFLVLIFIPGGFSN